MKIVVDLDNYQLEHCKRHVKEHYASPIEEAVVQGKPLDALLKAIKTKMEKAKYSARGQLKGTPNDLADGLDEAIRIISGYMEEQEEYQE